MKILASFCNVRLPGRPALVLLDPDTGDCHAVQVTGLYPGTGATGLAISERYLYVGLPNNWSNPSELLILDRRRLEILNRYTFHHVWKIHSLCVDGDRLYAVSTGTDQVVELQMQGSDVVAERPIWRPDPGGTLGDLHHLNSILCWRGELLVSGFGRKAGELWSLMRNGFAFNITQRKNVVDGIPHPHGRIAFCESGNAAVRILGGGHVQNLPGYARGLCCAGQYLFAGTSVGRLVSTSTGTINNPASGGKPAGRCAVCVLSLDPFALVKIVDMTNCGEEIYDLISIESTDEWSLTVVQAEPSISTWEALMLRLPQEVRDHVRPEDRFILVDEEVFRPAIFANTLVIPFLEKDGQYWGSPADDSTAIIELERLRASGAKFIVFAWPAFWWLDHYLELNRQLRSNFRCVLRNERLIIFDLRS